MTRIYLVRHGENVANITKEFSCRKIDYSLTEKGRLQAQQTADYLKTAKIKYIYASPLKRAVETAERIRRASGATLEVMELFREVDVGRLEGAPPTEENWGVYKQITADWSAGDFLAAFPEGEDFFGLTNRFLQGLRVIVEKHPDEAVIIVGHAGIFTYGTQRACAGSSSVMLAEAKNQNCSVSELRVTLEHGELNAQLLRWADCSHLSGVAADFVCAIR